MNGPALSSRWMRALWAAFLVSLPVTSFPFLPRVLGGAATVRPLAIYGLIGIGAWLLLRGLWRKDLPPALSPFLIFILIAFAGSLLAIFFPAPEMRNVSALDRVVRNLLTLALGTGYFMAGALVPQNREDLRFTVRWLLVGFAVALAWASLQAVYVIALPKNPQAWEPYFDFLNRLHHFISTRNLQEKRITGMAYEPSWFAEQLSILVLPWLLSGILERKSVFGLRWRGLQVEDFLFLWSAAIMVLTFSRTGLVIMVVLMAITVLAGRRSGNDASLLSRLLSSRRFGRRLAVFVVLAGLLSVVVFSLGSNNRYFSRLWRFWTDPQAGGNYWAYIAFGQRFIYWEAAIGIFEEQPILGVGLGNYALYFEDNLPEVPLFKYPEILDLITPAPDRTELVTPKNLFLRVLSETGLVGFAAFAGIWILVCGQTLGVWLGEGPDRAYWGRAGTLGLAASFLVAFSTDSFAMPNTWIMMGLIAGIAGIFGWDSPGLPADEELPVESG